MALPNIIPLLFTHQFQKLLLPRVSVLRTHWIAYDQWVLEANCQKEFKINTQGGHDITRTCMWLPDRSSHMRNPMHQSRK